MIEETEMEFALLRKDFEALSVAVSDSQTELRKDLTSLHNDVKDLVEAWRAMGFVGKFIKWFAGIAGAVMAAWAAFKGITLK